MAGCVSSGIEVFHSACFEEYRRRFDKGVVACDKMFFIGNSPTTKRSLAKPARGVGRGLRTSNSLRPQPAVQTAGLRIHLPSSQLQESYLITTNLFKSLELWEQWKAKTRASRDLTTRQLTLTVGAVAC